MTGILYLIPNTLGETALQPVLPADVIAISAQLDYFIGENAKSTRQFLKRIAAVQALGKPIQDIDIRELHVDTPPAALPDLLAPVLAGRHAGLVSEAGCPAIADPGANLVRLAHQHGVTVRPLVGPSSILLALMASGLNGQSFAFHGYLPTDAQARKTRIQALETVSRKENQTQLFIETPYRNIALFDALLQTCNAQTMLCVASDLTLSSEIVQTRSIHAWRGKTPDLQKRPSLFLLLASK